jgi:hypothetical protein
MPPAPRGDWISYGPSLVPAVTAISARNYMPMTLRALAKVIPTPVDTYDRQLRPNFPPNIEQVIQKIQFIDENKKN